VGGFIFGGQVGDFLVVGGGAATSLKNLERGGNRGEETEARPKI